MAASCLFAPLWLSRAGPFFRRHSSSIRARDGPGRPPSKSAPLRGHRRSLLRGSRWHCQECRNRCSVMLRGTEGAHGFGSNVRRVRASSRRRSVVGEPIAPRADERGTACGTFIAIVRDRGEGRSRSTATANPSSTKTVASSSAAVDTAMAECTARIHVAAGARRVSRYTRRLCS